MKNRTENSESVHKDYMCPYCGSVAPLVWVHGHGQCANCGINVEECCRGEEDKHGG